MAKKQYSLGKLIKKLEQTGFKDGEGKDKTIQFDFGSAIPTDLSSWRGDYAQLALGYELSGYDGSGNYQDCTVERLVTRLKETIGMTLQGWKGGDFVMKEDTTIWVANSGNSGGTIITGILDQGWYVVLLTRFEEY